MDSLNRRRFLERLGLSLAALPLGASALSAAAPRRRLLCFTKSSGFEHSVIKRGPNGERSLVERVLTEMGDTHGFEITFYVLAAFLALAAAVAIVFVESQAATADEESVEVEPELALEAA